MKPILWSTLILALTALPLAAQPLSGRGPHAEKVARALNLTEAQKASIQSIREKHRPDLVLRRDAIQQAQAAWRAAVQDAATPEAQLRALHDKASAARFEMMLARRSVHQEVQAVLTPEQRVKAAEMRGMAQARMRERMHHLRMAAGMAG
jgi:Spy/CpxP family protein refolding chaperone